MIVRSLQTKAPWLTAGAKYVVLEIDLTIQGPQLTVLTDSGGRERASYPLSYFEIVDGRLSRSWVITRHASLHLTTIGPKAWAGDDFWTDFDGDWADAMTFDDMERRSRLAIRVFDSAVADMYIEAGREWPNTPDAASDITRR